MKKEVNEYILQQPKERQEALQKLRKIITSNLPKGFEEVIQYNMISYVVPHSLYAPGYHVNPSDPLSFISLGNQKRHIALYHSGIYVHDELKTWFIESYKKLDIGKLDMGKSCIRFKNIQKIPYSLIGRLCTKITVADFVALYEQVRRK